MLAVGDSTKLEIIFSTKRYKNRVTKRPRIQTNEGPPNKYVQIVSHVVERPDSTYPVIIRPYKLDLSQFTQKVRDKITFEIKNVSDMKLDLSLVSVPEGLFELDLPKSVKPGGEVKGTLKLKKKAISESFQKSFTIQLNDEKKSRFTIPVKRTVRMAGTPGKTAVSNTGSRK